MSGGHLVYIWYSKCLVGICRHRYMSGVYVVLVRHADVWWELTDVWWDL